MSKIPVGATIAHAYRFTFSNVATLLRAIWLPLLAQLILYFFMIKRVTRFLAVVQARDPSVLTQLGPLLLWVLVALLLFFVQFTAAMETALGRPSASAFYFPLGRKMWRLLGATLAALLAIGGLMVVGLLALGAAGLLLDLLIAATPGNQVLRALLTALAMLVYGCSLFFFALRFLFLLAPVNLSEEELGVTRAWHLSAGNFWRILLVVLAVAVPVILINYAYQFALSGFPPSSFGLSREAAQAARATWQMKQANAIADHWYLTLPVSALLMFLQLGTGCAAQAFAYRTLTEAETSAPVAGV
jgi:hypothetical protein